MTGMKRALVLLLLVAACGGSSGGTTASAKDVYLGKAEAVCARANADLVAAKKKQPSAVAAVPAYVHTLVEIARTNVTELTKLSPPSGDAAQIQAKLIGPLTAQLSDADAYAAKVDAASAAKDTPTLTNLVFHPPTKTRADIAWMKGYGFKACVTAADTGAAAK